jgi:hypothetical protein
MDEFNIFKFYKLRLKYQIDFLKHCKGNNHLITKYDLRLKEIIHENFLKSICISNIFALYINYIRKNKSFKKTFISIFI